MYSWPDVTFGGSHEPYVDRMVDEAAYITRPKTVAAYGTVQGYPWSLVLFDKHGDPENDEPLMPDYQPAPARYEFFLGGNPDLPAPGPGGLGGDAGEARVRNGAHIDTNACSWATTPPLIGYVIFTSHEVSEIRVGPEAAESRTFRVERYLDGFPKFCVFFPPFAAPDTIEAVDGSGRVLHERRLFSGRVPVGSSFGGTD